MKEAANQERLYTEELQMQNIIQNQELAQCKGQCLPGVMGKAA